MIFWLFVCFILAGVLCLGQTLAIWQARSERSLRDSGMRSWKKTAFKEEGCFYMIRVT